MPDKLDNLINLKVTNSERYLLIYALNKLDITTDLDLRKRVFELNEKLEKPIDLDAWERLQRINLCTNDDQTLIKETIRLIGCWHEQHKELTFQLVLMCIEELRNRGYIIIESSYKLKDSIADDLKTQLLKLQK